MFLAYHHLCYVKEYYLTFLGFLFVLFCHFDIFFVIDLFHIVMMKQLLSHGY